MAAGFPEQAVRARARIGAAGVFPPVEEYGCALFGADTAQVVADGIDAMRLVPPIFMPQRLDKLVELGREPLPEDVLLDTEIGGLRSPLPVYVSAFGSTRVAGTDLGVAVARQAGRLALPIVVGESVVPVNGYGHSDTAWDASLISRIRVYAEESPPDAGGVVVQQNTEDANAEVWNLVYSDPSTQHLITTGRLAFELKVGQGAKPGLGGMTVVNRATAARLAGQFATVDLFTGDRVLRCGSPGTFTEEILRQQVRFMRNNYPRAGIWVKLHPGRDVGQAARLAWEAGADAVTIDGSEGGSGWAPSAFLGHVGLPLAECLRRVEPGVACMLVSGRMWEGARAVKSLALGARAVGLGRAALIAADEDPVDGLVNLVSALALEMRLLISALGKYSSEAVRPDDIWSPTNVTPAPSS